jgi:hypothetical protein
MAPDRGFQEATAEFGETAAQVGSAKAVWKQRGRGPGDAIGVGAQIGEAQTGGALACPLDRTVDVLKGFLSEDAVATEASITGRLVCPDRAIAII